jgi:hypothetical protein
VDSHGTVLASSFKSRCLFVADEWEGFPSNVPLISYCVGVSEGDDQKTVVIPVFLNLSDVTVYKGPVL